MQSNMSQTKRMLRDVIHRWQFTRPSWRFVIILSLILFSFGILIFIRPDTTTNQFIEEQANIQIDLLAGMLIIASGFVWVLYYFIRSLFAVLISLLPLVLVIFYLIIQIARSPTAPLFHLGTSLWFLILLLIVFYGAGELEAEKNARFKLYRMNREVRQQLQQLKQTQENEKGS